MGQQCRRVAIWLALVGVVSTMGMNHRLEAMLARIDKEKQLSAPNSKMLLTAVVGLVDKNRREWVGELLEDSKQLVVTSSQIWQLVDTFETETREKIKRLANDHHRKIVNFEKEYEVKVASLSLKLESCEEIREAQMASEMQYEEKDRDLERREAKVEKGRAEVGKIKLRLVAKLKSLGDQKEVVELKSRERRVASERQYQEKVHALEQREAQVKEDRAEVEKMKTGLEERLQVQKEVVERLKRDRAGVVEQQKTVLDLAAKYEKGLTILDKVREQNEAWSVELDNVRKRNQASLYEARQAEIRVDAKLEEVKICEARQAEHYRQEEINMNAKLEVFNKWKSAAEYFRQENARIDARFEEFDRIRAEWNKQSSVRDGGSDTSDNGGSNNGPLS